jgi:cytidylate kinase
VKLVFIYGPAAAGKLTVAKEVAARVGYPLFHNHLIVNAVSAVFPFGSPEFVRLRHEFWLRTFSEAARLDRSLLFTFAPEPTVPATFVQETIDAVGGQILFVKLKISPEEQERRIEAEDRKAHGKLSSLATLRKIRATEPPVEFELPVDLEIDTEVRPPSETAEIIVRELGLEVVAPYRAFETAD